MASAGVTRDEDGNQRCRGNPIPLKQGYQKSKSLVRKKTPDEAEPDTPEPKVNPRIGTAPNGATQVIRSSSRSLQYYVDCKKLRKENTKCLI